MRMELNLRSETILVTESPYKIVENAFHFTLNIIFVLKTLKSFSWLFVHEGKQLIREISLISKFVTSQPG